MDALAAMRADILSPAVRDGFDYWIGLRRGRPFPARREIDPTAIPRQLLRITLIDVTHDPLDFRLRLVGQHVRDRMGATPQTRVADTVKPEQGLDRLLRRYTLCVERRAPVRGLFRYIPLLPPQAPIWVEAVSCPLSGDDPERVDHIVNFASDSDFTVPAGAPEVP
ncbi:MAG: PAS domain-containing protein [Alphaproteobacteria bacterium]|nr:PAS domain-containing protein [Alphaproteobacteria bacterium]